MNRYLASFLLLAILAGVFIARGQKVSLGVGRDKTGYQVIQSIKDVYGTLPITADEIKARYDHIVEQVTKEVNEISHLQSDQQNKETVILALDKAMGYLRYLAASLEVIYLISPDTKVRTVGAEYYQKVGKVEADLFDGNKKLYAVIKKYAQAKAPHDNLTSEQQYFLDELLESMELVGLNLPDEQLAKVVELKKELLKLETTFETNIASDNRTLEVTQDELEGVPQDFIDALKKTDDGKFILKADYPTASTIARECAVGQTRKKFSKMMGQRGYPQNVKVLQDVIKLRKKLATLLGFESYAELDLKHSMIKTPKAAWNLQEELLPKAVEKSKKEFEVFSKDLPEGVVLSPNGKFYLWDFGYTTNYFKKKYYDIDESKLAEYFPMEQTIQGLFAIYEKFFGLKFEEIKNPVAWHPEVRLLKINKADGQELGYVFLDMFPRDNKYGHAAHAGVLQARTTGEGLIAPGVSVLICNFTPARGDKPSLLKYGEVTTFFHEFGHALHSLMGATKLVTQGGTSVKTDFVELPSQMLERWMEEKEILLNLSQHYKTGQKLPEALVEKKLKLLKLSKGIEEAYQIANGMFSLDLFDTVGEKDLDAVAQKYHAMTNRTTEYDPDNKYYASFGHLMGYGAKYYGYLLSRIWGTDVFESIKKEGLLDPKAGKHYADAILVPGGSKDPAQLVRDYLGREPSQEAFLKESGFQE